MAKGFTSTFSGYVKSVYTLVSNSPALFSLQNSREDNICTLKGAAVLTHNERKQAFQKEGVKVKRIINRQFWIIYLLNSTDNGQPQKICGESSEVSKALHQGN